MRETTRHRHAFDAYFQLGPERSLARLHAHLEMDGRAPTLRTLEEWSRVLRWQERIDAIERAAAAADDTARVSALREMRERHAREGVLLQQRGAEFLARRDIAEFTPETAIRALAEGVRIERLARGEITERTGTTGQPGEPRLEGISDDELHGIVEHIRRGMAGDQSAPAG